ncbi:MAG: hypothetical protein KC731_36290 [Myxococcales bacterium]|nr:hypothetical protein [Myxococcales bacterium]
MRNLVALLLAGLVACNVIGGIEPATLECPSDGVQNGRETGVDCGGPCAPCGDFQGCAADEDCASHVCEDATCQPASCYDGRQNGSESDVDCGGESEGCERCVGGAGCRIADDCAAGVGDAAACQEGVCRSLCCFYDCEGCADCADSCGAGSLGASCATEACLDPLGCLESDSGDDLCL